MSQSPLEPNPSLSQDKYQQAWSTLTRLLAEGRSFSGHEKNCFFLNTGDSRFSDISALSGFDFPDDGRGIALVDWDRDGDLDLWLSNRTGPRLRLLRNDSTNRHHFLQLRLQGTRCNRDAIGARVEITLQNEEKKLIKTLRAGQGFVSQSSKWIHFGLGKSDRIEKITVAWPGGPAEHFFKVAPDRRYKIVQGGGIQAFDNIEIEHREVSLKPSTLESPPRSDQARVFLLSRPRLPALRYTDQSGQEKRLDEVSKPVLINLWASWCKPCLTELNEWTQEHARIQASGLSIIALNVDQISSNEQGSLSARSFLQKISFSFPSGTASLDLVDTLDLVQRALMARHSPLPVPCSFLIDSQGRIAVIYKGPVPIDTLLQDVSLLKSDKTVLRNSSVPFSGRWLSPPVSVAAAQAVVRKMVNSEKLEQAAQYLSQEISMEKKIRRTRDPHTEDTSTWTLATQQYEHGIILHDLNKIEEAQIAFQKSLQSNPDYRPAQLALGTLLLRKGAGQEAIPLFEKAAMTNPSDRSVLRKLGLALLQQKRHAEAAERFQQALLLNAKDTDLFNKLGVVRLQQRNFIEAEQHFNKSLQLDPKNLNALNLLGQTKMQQREFQQAIELFYSALRINPRFAEVRFHLANVFQAQGETKKTVAQLRELLRLTPAAPQAAMASNNLAWILATDSDDSVYNPQEALQWAMKLNQTTNYQSPSALDTLAVSQAALGNFDQALETLEKAWGLAKSKKNKALAKAITQRRELFQSRKTYRESPSK